MKLKRKKIEDGDYAIVDEAGTTVARVQEWGNKHYGWRVVPTNREIKGWDTETIGGAIDGLTRELEARS